MLKAHILYSGMVQGVGFRFTTHRVALKHGLKGWVKNLPGGEVEILVEGQRGAIEELQQEIESYFEGMIRDKKVCFESGAQQFQNFRITY